MHFTAAAIPRLGLCLAVVVVAVLVAEHASGANVDYEEYYEDTEPSQNSKPQSQLDLTELVKAWKDYIKDRTKPATPARAAAGGGGGRQGGGGGRRRKAPKKKVRPVVQYEYEYEEEPAEEEVEEEVEEREPEEEYECEPRDDSYRTPDPKQCDKFTECNIKGEISVLLCPDGLMFDIKSEHCDYPAKVNCTGREQLQPAQAVPNCPRSNGFFAFPANESCQKFWDCREGKSYLQKCPEGVIFDPAIDACVTPDQSNRTECAAGKFLGFECPQYPPEAVLRFGDHDRLPSPDDCVTFFSCLKSGRPRLGVCPKKKVFSNSTGLCADPKTVPGCEHYWDDKDVEEDEYYT